jgi:hypothetical protein
MSTKTRRPLRLSFSYMSASCLDGDDVTAHDRRPECHGSMGGERGHVGVFAADLLLAELADGGPEQLLLGGEFVIHVSRGLGW